MRIVPALVAVATCSTVLLFSGAGAAVAAADPVNLGTAAGFAVLGATTVTNTGPSVISGDIGLSPGTAVTGFPPGVQSAGAAYIAEGVAGQAAIDASAAFVSANAQPGPPSAVTAELGGLTLTPDLYESGGVLQITGNLTLDAGGNAGALFIFRSDSTFITGAGSSITLIGNADPCNVYWIVPTSATLGTNSDLVGTVLAGASISATTGADIIGRLIALTGAVTLDTNDITSTGCSPVTAGGGGTTVESAASATAALSAVASAAAASGAAAVTPAALAPAALAHNGPDDVLLVSLTGITLTVLGSVALLASRRRMAGANSA